MNVFRRAVNTVVSGSGIMSQEREHLDEWELECDVEEVPGLF